MAKWTSLFYSGLSEKEDGVMLISIAMMFLVGMSMGWICKKIHLPSLFGMIVTGIVLGPYVLDVIDASILNISSDLRRIALIIILMRAGLSLDLNDLKKVGRPAVLMCFVPACFEIGGMVLLAPKLLEFRFWMPLLWERSLPRFLRQLLCRKC